MLKLHFFFLFVCLSSLNFSLFGTDFIFHVKEKKFYSCCWVNNQKINEMENSESLS